MYAQVTSVFVYVIVYTYVYVCTSHNNKPFTYLRITINGQLSSKLEKNIYKRSRVQLKSISI